MAEITFQVDGAPVTVDAPAWWTLAQALREGAGVTHVKLACGEGGCGACAVQVDGRVVHACLYPARRADGAEITTAYGLREGAVAQALIERGAPQCGYCVPGFVVAGAALVQAHGASLTEAQARDELRGNLCRCTGYTSIIDAILAAAQEGA